MFWIEQGVKNDRGVNQMGRIANSQAQRKVRGGLCGLVAMGLVALGGCASGETGGLPSLAPMTTGALPNPVEAVSGQVGEMAKATGLTKAPARNRLEELFAIERRCYNITSQDEVWQAVKEAKAERTPGDASAVPQVADPWTPENKAYFKEHCTEQAERQRSDERRSLHL